MDKLVVNENTVQETMLLPLYGRVMAARKFPENFSDPYSEKIMEGIEFNTSREDLGDMSHVIYGLRHKVAVDSATKYLKEFPEATIVNIGCGMDVLSPYVDNGKCRFVNIDFPDVIEMREHLIPKVPSEINLACDATDLSWIEKADIPSDKGFLVTSSGVFYYFHPGDVRKLFVSLAERFPHGAIQFDAESRYATEQSNRQVKKLGNSGAQMYFGIDNAKKELSAWSDRFESIEEMSAKEIKSYLDGIPFKIRAGIVGGFKLGLFKFITVRFK